LVAYFLRVGFAPLPEHVATPIDTSAFDELDPVEAAERLLELISVPTVTQSAPLSNLSASRLLLLHERRSPRRHCRRPLHLTPTSGLKTTYPAAHSFLRREVVNNYSLLYTLDGSDATLPPLLVEALRVTYPSANLTLHLQAHIASGRCSRQRG
jgi:hypothetical protein